MGYRRPHETRAVLGRWSECVFLVRVLIQLQFWVLTKPNNCLRLIEEECFQWALIADERKPVEKLTQDVESGVVSVCFFV